MNWNQICKKTDFLRIYKDRSTGEEGDELQLLNYYALKAKGKYIIEIGTMHGRTAILFALTCPSKQIISIDPFRTFVSRKHYVYSNLIEIRRYNKFINKINQMNLASNITHILSDSLNVYSFLRDRLTGLLFIDGNHSYKYVLNDLNNYIPLVMHNNYIAVHDIQKDDVKKALDEVKSIYSLKTIEKLRRLEILQRN